MIDAIRGGLSGPSLENDLKDRTIRIERLANHGQKIQAEIIYENYCDRWPETRQDVYLCFKRALEKIGIDQNDISVVGLSRSKPNVRKTFSVNAIHASEELKDVLIIQPDYVNKLPKKLREELIASTTQKLIDSEAGVLNRNKTQEKALMDAYRPIVVEALKQLTKTPER